MIQSLEELAKALIRERSAQAALDFRPSVRPLYRLVRSRPEYAGSCILLRIGGCPILSTAGHVLDNITDGFPLFVGGPVGTHPVLIQGGVLRTTSKPQGNRRRDHLDCGFWKIPEEAVQALGRVEFLDASRISRNRAATVRRCYMAMGYRQSGNKRSIDHLAKTIGNRASRYSGSVVEIPKLAEKLGVSGAEHMFLQFPKYAQGEDDRRTRAYDPAGFSGGPLVDLGDFTSVETYAPGNSYRAALSGMLIEHYSDHRALVAVKIGLIVDGIQRSLARPAGYFTRTL